jgi:outer membrane protein
VRRAAVVALAAALAAGPALAEEAPLWELGLGLGAITFPDYRGSDRQRGYLLPVPFVSYRGEFLEANRDRVRGVLYRGERAEVDISINGSVPVDSDGAGAREGMPDLDPTLEIGPSFNWRLERTPTRTLTFRLPVRAVVASDFRSLHSAGALVHPNVALDLRLDGHWKLGLQAGALFGDRRYHDYFYGVAPEYARAGRPAYRAGGGYSGAQLAASLTKRFDNFFVGAFVKADFLGGAEFHASPLVERRDNLAAGVAVTWVFSRSERRVTVRD